MNHFDPNVPQRTNTYFQFLLPRTFFKVDDRVSTVRLLERGLLKSCFKAKNARIKSTPPLF